MLPKNAIPTNKSMKVHLERFKKIEIINIRSVNPEAILRVVVQGGFLSNSSTFLLKKFP